MYLNAQLNYQKTRDIIVIDFVIKLGYDKCH